MRFPDRGAGEVIRLRRQQSRSAHGPGDARRAVSHGHRENAYSRVDGERRRDSARLRRGIRRPDRALQRRAIPSCRAGKRKEDHGNHSVEARRFQNRSANAAHHADQKRLSGQGGIDLEAAIAELTLTSEFSIFSSVLSVHSVVKLKISTTKDTEVHRGSLWIEILNQGPHSSHKVK